MTKAATETEKKVQPKVECSLCNVMPRFMFIREPRGPTAMIAMTMAINMFGFISMPTIGPTTRPVSELSLRIVELGRPKTQGLKLVSLTS